MGKILVLDDQAVNREFLTELLQYGGHSVLEASEGNAALALVQSATAFQPQRQDRTS
jgi:CheY-like chemotaxis protein